LYLICFSTQLREFIVRLRRWLAYDRYRILPSRWVHLAVAA
jgi:hypothetical protein